MPKANPAQEMQKKFLAELASSDMTHGGIPYALKYEGFRYVDNRLALSNFTHGEPTYAPDLKKAIQPQSRWSTCFIFATYYCFTT